jgi:hypothetical protein
MTLNHKVPSHVRALYTHNLGILTFHCTRTQLWNQAHNRGRLSSFQHKLTPSQKCRPSGRRSGEFFVKRRMMYGPLACAAIPCKETSLLCCRLRVRASLGSHTCGIFLKFALNASIDTLPTFTNLKRWGKRVSVYCHLCGNTVKQMLFFVLVHCNHTMDQVTMTWRHDSVLKHGAGCLKSALESTVEVYCDLEGLQAPGGGSWRRHRDQSWSSLTGRSMVGIEYPWSSLHIPGTLTLIRPRNVRSLGMQASRGN